MNYAVIMAGGSGKRLWPLSRRKKPKQVLDFIAGETLLRSCFKKLTSLFDYRNILVMTNADYIEIVREELPELPSFNVIAEPVVRDTTGAISLAATILTKFDPQANMVVLSADQILDPPEALQQAIKDALSFVEKNPESLVTFGLKPTFANTQLGYIKCVNPVKCDVCENSVYTVDSFKEKPDKATAEEYLKEGDYMWNSGIFTWKAATILERLREFLPEIVEPLAKIKKDWQTTAQNTTLNEYFAKLPKISIDFAVMEKASDVKAFELDCRWIDLGAFNSLADFIKKDDHGNIVVAKKYEMLDCKNDVIVSNKDNHLVAAIGLENVVIVHTSDVTLVCNLNQTHRIKELLEEIEKHGGKKYL
ncbi:MAG: mannose-1-phosphate guanylyltransferase [Phycisphaerae bacterium]|nr:mannose-1-phosphate guanylyltransferase [Phycisphaerae bacterium]